MPNYFENPELSYVQGLEMYQTDNDDVNSTEKNDVEKIENVMIGVSQNKKK